MKLLSKNEILEQIIKMKCFKKGEFILKSGKTSEYYINLRNLIQNPIVIASLTHLLFQKIKTHFSDLDFNLCGLPYAGIPYANCLSITYNIPLIFLRKQAKTHGMKNWIDGIENLKSRKVVVIDDVITTGSSINDSNKIFDLENLSVIGVFVLIDRRCQNLKEAKKNIISLFDFQDLLDYYSYMKINEELKLQNILIKKRQPFEKRIKMIKSKLGKKIVDIMLIKKSNLAVSLDFDSFPKILDTLNYIGEHIIIAKIHIDIIKDFKPEYIKNLVDLSKRLKFFIFEDRKFSEISHIFSKQFQNGIYKISEWCNLTTFHCISGGSNVINFKNIYDENNQGALLVAQMSNENNFINSEYTQKVVDCGIKNESVTGFICQKKIAGDEYLYLTPGISINHNKDNLDQKYITPYKAIVENGTDIIIVGRSICESDNILKSTLLYKDIGWSNYLSCILDK